MQCPVCGEPLPDAGDVLDGLDTRFAPCPDCPSGRLDPRKAPGEQPEPCSCGRRSLDGVMAAVHAVFVDEGLLDPAAPLAAVGTPLLHPLFPMRRPPFLPPESLVLLTRSATPSSARRLLTEVPEIRGVVLDRGVVPGVGGAAHVTLAGLRRLRGGPFYAARTACALQAGLDLPSRGPPFQRPEGDRDRRRPPPNPARPLHRHLRRRRHPRARRSPPARPDGRAERRLGAGHLVRRAEHHREPRGPARRRGRTSRVRTPTCARPGSATTPSRSLSRAERRNFGSTTEASGSCLRFCRPAGPGSQPSTRSKRSRSGSPGSRADGRIVPVERYLSLEGGNKYRELARVARRHL